tara:strand:- start:479 stop:727 length:249 start_codon:yes stop_codon:yes gene_type:complete
MGLLDFVNTDVNPKNLITDLTNQRPQFIGNQSRLPIVGRNILDSMPYNMRVDKGRNLVRMGAGLVDKITRVPVEIKTLSQIF